LKFYFSWGTTVICLVLILGMLRASYWQWERHNDKQDYIEFLDKQLALPVDTIDRYSGESRERWQDLIHRRFSVKGHYDFAHEIVLRNRRHDGMAGVHVITPLVLKDSKAVVLVNRGFLPLELSTPEKRKAFQLNPEADLIGLVKETQARRFLAPRDFATGKDKPRLDAWLRVDIDSIAKQLPYEVLPVYLEIMLSEDLEEAKSQIVTSESGKDELLFLPLRGVQSHAVDKSGIEFPVPVFNTVVPPGRHWGYVFEWAIMALFTLLIGIIIQLRPPRSKEVKTRE